MNGAIAVFVKTPGLSPVKTRLAVKLGQEKAEAFHLASSRAVSAVTQALSKLEDIHSYYAVAEEQALTHRYWQGLPCLWQGDGGLGDRMATIYQGLLTKHDFVILVGADIPQITVPELLKASAILDVKGPAQLVFGPSIDGGFWLIGGNCKIPHSIWTGVTYSKHDTGAKFFNKIEQIADVRKVASLCDVDEPDDLILLHRTLQNLSNPLGEQLELVRFLDNCLD